MKPPCMHAPVRGRLAVVIKSAKAFHSVRIHREKIARRKVRKLTPSTGWDPPIFGLRRVRCWTGATILFQGIGEYVAVSLRLWLRLHCGRPNARFYSILLHVPRGGARAVPRAFNSPLHLYLFYPVPGIRIKFISPMQLPYMSQYSMRI
jgi:hypothetical protein